MRCAGSADIQKYFFFHGHVRRRVWRRLLSTCVRGKEREGYLLCGIGGGMAMATGWRQKLDSRLAMYSILPPLPSSMILFSAAQKEILCGGKLRPTHPKIFHAIFRILNSPSPPPPTTTTTTVDGRRCEQPLRLAKPDRGMILLLLRRCRE